MVREDMGTVLIERSILDGNTLRAARRSTGRGPGGGIGTDAPTGAPTSGGGFGAAPRAAPRAARALRADGGGAGFKTTDAGNAATAGAAVPARRCRAWLASGGRTASRRGGGGGGGGGGEGS
jgi:hypothetical protein